MALLRELKERAAAATKPLEQLAVTFHNSLNTRLSCYTKIELWHASTRTTVSQCTHTTLLAGGHAAQESGNDMALPASILDN